MIRKATVNDASCVAELAMRMWEDNTLEGLSEELAEIIASPESAVFLLYEGGTAIGFVQCQLRHDYVEGTDSSPVGYMEGIFVDEVYRNKGYAQDLLKQCEAWAREMGCTEFASDCELTNTGSLAFHLKMGFEEANRVICFTKKL